MDSSLNQDVFDRHQRMCVLPSVCRSPFRAFVVQAKVLEGYRDQLAQQSELADTFDFSEATTEARGRISNIFEELSMAKDVWDTVALCDRQFEVWKKTLWNDIDTDIMEDASKAFVKEVCCDNMPYLHAITRKCGTALPLCASLLNYGFEQV